MELISIIVPVYKVEPYLERCINSILKQTYSRFELILVDDGSPDKCREICDKYAMEDKRIKVFHQENAGLSQARNVGIEFALNNEESEWISFIDSDDWIHPEYLERLYDAVKNTNTQISVCDFVKTRDVEYSFDDVNIQNEMVTPEYLFRKRRVIAIVAWGKLYNKKLFKEIRYPVGKIREDEFVTWKVLFQSEKIVMVHKPLYVYFQREGSIFNSRWTKDHLVVIEAFEEELDFFGTNGYERAYLHTVGPYIRFMGAAIENLNRYYPSDEQINPIKQRLKELFYEYKEQLNLTICEKLIIYSMLLPINANIVPWSVKKVKYIREVYGNHGMIGIVKKIKSKIFI